MGPENVQAVGSVVSNFWRIYLTDMGCELENHIPALEVIRNASEDDEIEVLITSSGGYVDTARAYVSAFKDTSAKITTRAIGECASAATIVFLAGDVRVCDDGSYFMFHNDQFSEVNGDLANISKMLDFYKRLAKEEDLKCMEEILTEHEINSLFENAGVVYLTATDMRSRLEIKAEETITTPRAIEKQGLSELTVGELVGLGRKMGVDLSNETKEVAVKYIQDMLDV